MGLPDGRAAGAKAPTIADPAITVAPANNKRPLPLTFTITPFAGFEDPEMVASSGLSAANNGLDSARGAG